MDHISSLYSTFYRCFYIFSIAFVVSCKDDHPDTPDISFEVYKEVRHTGTAEVSQARMGMTAAAAGHRILFAGGYITTLDMGVPGSAIIYKHSNRVDIYDARSNTWSIDSLDIRRSAMAAVSLDGKVFFAGGYFTYNDAFGFPCTKRIDIYNTTTNTWQTDSLTEKKYYVAAGVVGNKAVFAGGMRGYQYGEATSLDIYDMGSNTWIRSQLTVPFSGNAVVAGNELFIVRGNGQVDIYNVTSNSQRTIQLSIARTDVAIAAAGGFVLFAGGVTADNSAVKLVDIYDTRTNTWSKDSLSQARYGIGAVAAGNKILFAGGAINDISNSNVVDIYDIVTRSWSRDSLSYPSYHPAGATIDNKVLLASGSQLSSRVDIFELKK